MKPIRKSMENTLADMRDDSVGAFYDAKADTKKTLKRCSNY